MEHGENLIWGSLSNIEKVPYSVCGDGQDAKNTQNIEAKLEPPDKNTKNVVTDNIFEECTPLEQTVIILLWGV